MIAQLSGELMQKQLPHILINVQGVGYEVLVSMTTGYDLPELGAMISLWTQFIVREDSHTLYGFATQSERTLFRELIRVNGVGPKVALSILSGMNSAELLQTLTEGDAKRLTGIPGIGAKTAERLLLDLRGRLNHPDLTALMVVSPKHIQVRDKSHLPLAQQEAVNALISLGYKSAEATAAMSRIDDVAGHHTEDLIRLALKQLLRH